MLAGLAGPSQHGQDLRHAGRRSNSSVNSRVLRRAGRTAPAGLSADGWSLLRVGLVYRSRTTGACGSRAEPCPRAAGASGARAGHDGPFTDGWSMQRTGRACRSVREWSLPAARGSSRACRSVRGRPDTAARGPGLAVRPRTAGKCRARAGPARPLAYGRECSARAGHARGLQGPAMRGPGLVRRWPGHLARGPGLPSCSRMVGPTARRLGLPVRLPKTGACGAHLAFRSVRGQSGPAPHDPRLVRGRLEPAACGPGLPARSQTAGAPTRGPGLPARPRTAGASGARVRPCLPVRSWTAGARGARARSAGPSADG